MSYGKKDDELGGGVGVFFQDKSTVLQEARVFNESPISPRKCRILLTKIVYLLYMGQSFGTHEATTLFFGVTKLFQHKDPALRQMVYLVIKELSGIAEDVIMVTSSIMKDMQPNLEVIYRPNAIRALCRITDAQMIQGLERFFKSAIVDKNSFISSAALVSSIHLQPIAKDVIKRWANEAQEALNAKQSGMLGMAPSSYGSSYLSGFQGGSQQSGFQGVPSTSFITQYHALGLLYLIRQTDRMAIHKLIQQLGTQSGGAFSKQQTVLRSPMAICMLIRFAAKTMEEDPNVNRQMTEILESYLRHKSDMVNFEAARALCASRTATASSLARPIAVLQLFLSSPKSTLKFAAIRTLSSLAIRHPQAVSGVNLEMEKLINDDNRSVATYAITTLLKTGNEASVDRLMKQITTFMSEISDEFKVIVVNAIRALCLKFPSKQGLMLTFLSGVLRDEGGYDFKRAVVEAIFDMIKFIDDSKEAALAQLCEFIEDCEFTKLSVRILHLLGLEGPKTPQPSKYIRYIYNRVVLENAIVRAAAVSSLAKFGVCGDDGSLRSSVRVLLTRCLDDVDDEVRDRAAMYLRVLDDEPLADTFVRDESVFSLEALEMKLVGYISSNSASAKRFDATDVPKISREAARQEALKARPDTAAILTSDAKAAEEVGVDEVPTNGDSASLYAAQLATVPELAAYGDILKSSDKPVELTDRDTEYMVSVVKHIFKEHVVFQFNIRNTLPETVLDQVSVLMTSTADDPSSLTEDFIIPIPTLNSSSPSGTVYVSFTRNDPSSFALGSFSNALKFVSKEVDPNTGEPEEDGYEDEYVVEEVDLGAGDYMSPSYANFTSDWEKMKAGPSKTEVFSLSTMESIQAATDQIVELLKLEPLGGSQTAASPSVHTLNLSGLVCGGLGKVLVRARMTYRSGDGVTLEMAVRGEHDSVPDLVLSAIA